MFSLFLGIERRNRSPGQGLYNLGKTLEKGDPYERRVNSLPVVGIALRFITLGR